MAPGLLAGSQPSAYGAKTCKRMLCNRAVDCGVIWLLHHTWCSQSRVARWPIFHQPGQYFTANSAEAGILKISGW